MTGEIDRDNYCSADAVNDDDNRYCGIFAGPCNKGQYGDCRSYHRKWVTPEQFKEEYGHDYPDDGAVYYRRLRRFTDSTKTVPLDYYAWEYCSYSQAKENNEYGAYPEFNQIICACTPWGCPPAGLEAVDE